MQEPLLASAQWDDGHQDETSYWRCFLFWLIHMAYILGSQSVPIERVESAFSVGRGLTVRCFTFESLRCAELVVCLNSIYLIVGYRQGHANNNFRYALLKSELSFFPHQLFSRVSLLAYLCSRDGRVIKGLT